MDPEAVRVALVENFLGRLDDLESGFVHIEENITGGAIPGDGIRSMQIDPDDLEAIFDTQVLLSRRYLLTMKDVQSWIERATAMESMDGKHALFAELAALEDEFEHLEQKVREAVWSIDEAANMRCSPGVSVSSRTGALPEGAPVAVAGLGRGKISLIAWEMIYTGICVSPDQRVPSVPPGSTDESALVAPTEWAAS
ncbi:hypothetical protein ACWDZ8_25865 [Streptomyces sp. NPDC003233]